MDVTRAAKTPMVRAPYLWIAVRACPTMCAVKQVAMTLLRRIGVALSLVLVAIAGGQPRPTSSRASVLPQLMLWAWERPESLQFAGPDVGVAFLAESIYLEPRPEVRYRMQPLQVTKTASLVAVVRLEPTPRTPATFDSSYITTVAQWIAATASLPQVRAVQIDFDATRSQRPFYRALLAEVHRQLPAGTPLSITALGSWCLGDDWLANLPIDEAVPMMFRLGVDRRNILHDLAAGQDFSEPLCRTSLGISTDEPWPRVVPGRRIYVFNPRAWNRADLQALEQKLAQ